MKSKHFLGRRASACIAVSPEDTFYNNKSVCVLSFLLAFIAEQTSYAIEHPFGHLGSDILAVYPLQILPSPSLLARGKCETIKDSLYAVQALLSSSQNTFLTKYSTMTAAVGKITSISARPSTSVQTCTKGQDL